MVIVTWLARRGRAISAAATTDDVRAKVAGVITSPAIVVSVDHDADDHTVADDGCDAIDKAPQIIATVGMFKQPITDMIVTFGLSNCRP